MKATASGAALLLTLGVAGCSGGGAGVPALAPTPDADGYVTTGSGLRYRVISRADGPRPTARDRVVVHYRCELEDGTVVDSSYDRGTPDVVALRDLIPGFREALQLMSAGSHFQVIVPGRLGYGWEGIDGVVGPNETLFFEIQLFRIVERRGAGIAERRGAGIVAGRGRLAAARPERPGAVS